MKLLISKILIILIFLPLYLHAQDCYSTLIINSDITNSVVYVDTVKIGEGKKIISQVTKGIHKVLVMENSDRWNAQTFIDTINVEECNQTIKLNFNFKSQTYLQTNPQDAYVFSNDSLIGHTPLFISSDIEHVSLKKPGYSSIDLKINHDNPNQLANLVFTGKPEQELFVNKNLFKILLGGIVVFGGITAYFKIKADKRFDTFQSTGDNYYLDETHKFDLISGISFGALQVNFGLLLYYLLFN